MKEKVIKPLAATVWLACGVMAVAQGTTAINYQGSLNENGLPGNKSYDFEFLLFDAPTVGSQVGQTLTVPGLAVANGLFSATLDFGVGAFTGGGRWLEIAIRPAGSGAAFTTLTPRQQVYPVPYALYAARATTVDGTANLTFTGTVSFNPASGPPFSVSSATKVPNLNADLLDGLDASAFVAKAGDTLSGNLTLANPAFLSFGSTARQMVNLFGTQYALGVQANTLYARSHNNFAWFKDGTHSDTGFDPGAGGKVLMTLDASSRLNVPALGTTVTLNDLVIVGLNGYPIGVNAVASGDVSTGVHGRADGVGSMGLFGEAIATSGESWGVRGVSYSATGVGVYGLNGGGTGSDDPAGVRGEATGFDGNGVVGVANNGPSAYALWGKSTSGYAGQFNGAVRVTFSSPFDKPQLEIHESADAGFARLRMQTGSQPFWDIALGTQAAPDLTNSLRFFNNGVGDVMTISPQGHVHLRVLTIDGGADVAEPFAMSATNLSKGAVVVIDPASPGHLKLSTRAYDTRVAGVISGAAGVNPGLSLSQRGVVDGEQPVALTGRVYVQADASYGAIEPGDLLTTSDTPGHAMKVTDRGRAQGAILGKAMTGLAQGTGLLLVLVTLQ